MLKENFHVAVPTAFFEDESLDIKGTMDHIRNLKGQGVKSVLVSGTTGEQHSLNLQEKLEMVEALESEGTLVDDMEIIFGVASIRQKEAEQLAKVVGETKIAGVMLGYPPYIRPSQAE
ncbi:dihydrodipicolinate synthase family protein, partial [Salinicoccus roseus]